MQSRFVLRQTSRNVPRLSNFAPRLVAGLGKFCGLFCKSLIEITGKPLASRGVFSRRALGKSFRKL
jgi:hypothetical protein